MTILPLPPSQAQNANECWIAKLPNEIMFDIILLACLPAIYPRCHLDHATYRRASDAAQSQGLSPIELATVCSVWKDLVFSTRNLWTAFSIYAKHPNIPRVKRYLELSGPNTPLSIRLFAKEGDIISDDSIGDTISNAMAFIDENLHRIAYLCLDFPAAFFRVLASGSRILPDAAPILEEFHIHHRDERPKIVDFKLCVNPPSPQKVSFSGVVCPKIQVDWFHVTHLILGHRKASSSSSRSWEVLDLLSMAKSLVELKSDMSTTQHLTRTSTIHHDSIRRISLYAKDPSFLVFANTTMPSLESLTIYEFCLGSSIQALFLAFLQRSACPLTSLELSFIDAPEGEDLIAVCQQTSMIQDLILRFTSPSGDELLLPFLDHLSSRVSQGTNAQLLPHLQKFHYSGMLSVPLSAFLDIMEYRHKATQAHQIHGALDELVVEIPSTNCPQPANPVGEDDLNRILALRKAKKTFSVSWRTPSRGTVDFVEETMGYITQHLPENPNLPSLSE